MEKGCRVLSFVSPPRTSPLLTEEKVLQHCQPSDTVISSLNVAVCDIILGTYAVLKHNVQTLPVQFLLGRYFDSLRPNCFPQAHISLRLRVDKFVRNNIYCHLIALMVLQNIT